MTTRRPLVVGASGPTTELPTGDTIPPAAVALTSVTRTFAQGAYTAADGEYVLADASGGTFTVTLPATGVAAVKKTDTTTNVVTVAASSGKTLGTMGAASLPLRLSDQAMITQVVGTNHLITHGYQSLSALDARYVPVTQRGPIGGVATPTYAGTVTPDATTTVHARYVATGNLTINPPTGGVDGQPLFIEVQASGASRTVTFSSSVEPSGSAPSLVSVIASGGWGTYLLRNRADTWRLMHADPQNVAVAAPADVQVFTAAGTWTKPAGAATVHIVCIAGGGGGGGGGRAPSGTAYSGGAGGGGGGLSWTTAPASTLGSTETVAVGAGGTAGAAATASSTGGGAGGAGGPSTVGPSNGHYKAVAFGGAGGAGGSSAASTAGAGGSSILGGSAGAAGTAGAAGAAGGSPQMSGAGGGSGAGLAASPAALAGGNGGAPIQAQLTVAAGGTTSGSADGGSGGNITTNSPMGGGGGGGGASRAAATSGSGGAGGRYGAGGGGGATSANGQVAGAGGVGCSGLVVITSWS